MTPANNLVVDVLKGYQAVSKEEKEKYIDDLAEEGVEMQLTHVCTCKASTKILLAEVLDLGSNNIELVESALALGKAAVSVSRTLEKNLEQDGGFMDNLEEELQVNHPHAAARGVVRDTVNQIVGH